VESIADTLIKEGKSQEAIDYIHPLLFDPEVDSVALRLNLARAYTQIHQNEHALQVITNLLKVFPGNLEGLVALSKLQLYLEKFDEAELTLLSLLAIDENNINGIVGYARLTIFKYKDCTDALQILSRLSSIETNNVKDANAYYDAGT
jgi:predicted Zn-dependent protease